MPPSRGADIAQSSNPWPLVLCLVGVDYFSTLAYLPSIAVQAAGPYAPVAAGVVVLVTFLLTLPVYWYLVRRSPDGRGATGLLEDRVPGWRGKLIVLSLLGFAAADFVITRSLSLADAAVHVIHNPLGNEWIKQLPVRAAIEEQAYWWPLTYLLNRLVEPQVAVTLVLSIVSFAVWQSLRRGVTRRVLWVMAGAVSCYLALSAIIVVSAIVYITEHRGLVDAWVATILPSGPSGDAAGAASDHAWIWAWLGMALWSFPQMALGLSGFEMVMTVVPGVSGGPGADAAEGRIRNSRKLLIAAASIMAVYLVSAVTVTALLVPHVKLTAGGAAEHRALAYIAHGSPLVGNPSSDALNPLFGTQFGAVFDLSSVIILCLAGATVTMGLQNLIPHYLSRLGMEVSWAGKVGVVLHVLNAVVLVVTVIFRASPSSQQWAYAASVLVLLAGAAMAVAVDLASTAVRQKRRTMMMAYSAGAAVFFLGMTTLTVFINHSGLTIAIVFVAAILVTSFISRWIRSTELRFEGFDFSDDAAHERWNELCKSGPKVLAPHRPGLVSLTEKSRALQRDYRLDAAIPVIFIEAILGDPSNFYQKPLMKIEREDGLEVIRVSQCVSVSHVLAAVCLELCRDGGCPPEIIFGWSHEQPLAANLNFLLLGEGNIPWMVKELVRKAMPDSDRQPRVIIG